MIERVVEWLHGPPCPNDQASGYDMTNIINIFWREFKHWQNMTGIPMPFVLVDIILLML